MMGAGLYKKYIKRLLDLMLSTIAIVVLSPVLAVLALIVRIQLGKPIIFKQARPGKNEKIFYLYKFRSMTNETDTDGKLLPDAQRLKKFGKFLRASSLDELLELVNIIKGDMSIVGPRPLSIYYLPHYNKEQRRRQSVRPGLTGLAQVHGRNNLQWDDRFKMDIEYVDHITFWCDVKIIFNTIFKVLKNEDVTIRGTTKVYDFGPYSILKEQGKGGKGGPDETYSEIGGYFWLNGSEKLKKDNEIPWLPIMDDSSLTISGRAAIDVALRDILNQRKINKVYVPSYCCVSMLQPIIDRQIKFEFYNVEYIAGRFNYRLPATMRNSIILIMNYFGIGVDETIKAVKKAHDEGAIIIEDITHSLLSDMCGSEESDYFITSFRQWFPVASGGWVGKMKGNLAEKPMLDSNYTVSGKINAMKEEYSYITGRISSKDDFLLKQAKFENDLIHVDKMLKIDDLSLSILAETDVKEIIGKRRENSSVLFQGLQDLKEKNCVVPNIDLNMETPIFFPILLAAGERDSLKSHLAHKGIYCPIHWPETMGAVSGVRPNELSLVCDQRYNAGDMKTIVDEIHCWYAGQV